MILVAVEGLPAGSKPPAAVSLRISSGKQHGFGAAVPYRPRRHPCEGGREVQLSCRSWSNLSGRLEPFLQNSYPYSTLDLLQLPPYAYESSCLLLRLPSWQDVVTEHPAQGLLNAILSLSSPPDFLAFVQSLSSKSPYTSASVCWSELFLAGERGRCPWG